MANHPDLPNDELHEPLHIQEAVSPGDAGKVIIAKGDGTSELRFLQFSDFPEVTNVVYIKDESDFPTPVSSVIPLASNTTYVITKDVTVTATFSYGQNTKLDGINAGQATLTYAGILPLLSNAVAEASLRIDNLHIAAASAALFGVTDAADAGTIRMESSTFTAASIGTINNVSIFQGNQLELTLSTNGVTFTGVATNPILNITNTTMDVDAGTIFNVSAVVIGGGRIEFCNLRETSAGVIGFNSTGLDNVAADSAMVVSNSLVNVTTPLAGGVTTTSRRWTFDRALPLADTQVAETVNLSVAEEVTINTIGVYEQILGGNWTFTSLTDGLVISTDGITTAATDRTITGLVVATATVAKVGGGTDVVSARLAKNGVTIPESQSSTQNSTPTTVTCVGVVQVEDGDTLELMVANETTTANVTVSLASINMIRA